MTTKLADSKGRVMLGNRFANCTFLVDDSDPHQIVLTPAVAVPAREAWLYQNQKALASLRRGLAQAKAGQFSKSPPDLDADSKLLAESED